MMFLPDFELLDRISHAILSTLYVILCYLKAICYDIIVKHAHAEG